MKDLLKTAVRGTILERPARRLYGLLQGTPRGASSPQLESQAGTTDELVLAEAAGRSSPHLDANADYDAQTVAVMETVLRADAVCVDVGCHVGQMLDAMRRLAPDGHHYGFEPLPDLAEGLLERYAECANVTIYNVALNDEPGTFTFQHVRSNPGYSGFRKRRYDRPDEEVVATEVIAQRLDDVLRTPHAIDFMKIDVEGAELHVLRGAREILARSQPVIVFEHGLGAADYYDTRPQDIYAFLESLGYQVFLMTDWLSDNAPLSRDTFVEQFDTGKNYYFMACHHAPFR